MNKVIVTDKKDWQYNEYLQNIPLKEERNFRGWAYKLVTTLMDDSFLFDTKAEKQKRKYSRRLKKIILRAFKKYKAHAKITKKALEKNGSSMALYCLVHFGWRVRKNKKDQQYLIESN
jgi:hypothetical protein